MSMAAFSGEVSRLLGKGIEEALQKFRWRRFTSRIASIAG
jgi:hypothetical protein